MDIFIFWFLNVFIGIAIYKNNFSKKYVIFDDILFFSGGFIYYWIIPYYYFFINKQEKIYSFIDITKYTNNLDEKNKILFLIFCYIIYFIYYFVSRFVKKRIRINSLQFDKNSLFYDIATIPFLCISLIYLFTMRSQFMTGYTTDYDISKRGPLLTVSLLIFSIAIIKSRNIKFVKNWQMILYWIIALFILTLGTRLYFVSSILTVLAIYYTYKKRLNKYLFYLFIFFLVIVFSIIGIIRQGNNLSTNLILYIFLGEPLYTSYSLFSFLKLNELPWLNIPTGLIVDFINLIPTILLPKKIELMQTLYISKYNYVSPLGAKNIFVSLMENFGLLGSLVFIMLFAFFIAIINKKLKYSYYIVLGILCFSFFRDPFSISILKYLFQISLLAPIYYYCINKFFRCSIITVRKFNIK